MLQKFRDFLSQVEKDETPVVPPVVPTPPVTPVAPVVVPPVVPPVVPEPVVPPVVPEPVATAAETIIPPPGVVTSAAPTGEAMYMVMSKKELADLAIGDDPALMTLLRGPVTGIK